MRNHVDSFDFTNEVDFKRHCIIASSTLLVFDRAEEAYDSVYHWP